MFIVNCWSSDSYAHTQKEITNTKLQRNYNDAKHYTLIFYQRCEIERRNFRVTNKRMAQKMYAKWSEWAFFCCINRSCPLIAFCLSSLLRNIFICCWIEFALMAEKRRKTTISIFDNVNSFSRWRQFPFIAFNIRSKSFSFTFLNFHFIGYKICFELFWARRAIARCAHDFWSHVWAHWFRSNCLLTMTFFLLLSSFCRYWKMHPLCMQSTWAAFALTFFFRWQTRKSNKKNLSKKKKRTHECRVRKIKADCTLYKR